MSRFKAIIHDWDDTITNSFETYATWFGDFASFYGLKVPTLNEVKPHWAKSIPEIISGVWNELTVQEATEKFYKFVPPKKYEPLPFDGVEDSLTILKRSGVLLGVLTSGIKMQTELMYKKHFGDGFMFHEFVLCKEDCEFHKPDKRVFDLPISLFNKKGIKKDEIVYVGDHTVDFESAQNAGLSFVAVTTGVIDKSKFLDLGILDKDILNSFSDLPKYLGIS